MDPARRHRIRPLPLAAVLAGGLLLAGAGGAAGGDGRAGACAVPGAWIDPADGSAIAHDRLIADMAARPVVLLGEHHDDAGHHRWQLHTLAALHGRRPDMAIGFEAFPRRVQPVLDRWVAGELSADAFLADAGWAEVWGFDADLYLPLFEFARLHRVPMLALNVERDLVARVGREGFDAVPPGDREGVSKPAPPPDAYIRSLARVYDDKKRPHRPPSGDTVPGTQEADRSDIAETLADPAFRRFVDAQLTWDRAMAEAIVGARAAEGAPLVVGILGQGHVEHRWGVPHQLADLGIPDAAVLLPVAPSEDCAGVPPDLADAVFTVPPAGDPPPPGPRLGVMIETVSGGGDGSAGARVIEVVPGGVAEATGIEAGDIIVEAAGRPIAKSGDLIATVRQQSPGTWLPLKVQRDGATVDRVARFPPNPAEPQ